MILFLLSYCGLIGITHYELTQMADFEQGDMKNVVEAEEQG